MVEGDYIYLRINFFNPGGIGKPADSIDKENIYVKELWVSIFERDRCSLIPDDCRTYRASHDKKEDSLPASNNLYHVHKLILETQKKFKDQEQERKQMEVSSSIWEICLIHALVLYSRVWSNKTL